MPDERPPFKKGAIRIYQELNIACQPVAINSGNVWPKRGRKNSHKTITISILSPMNAGMNRESFLENLESKIYNELNLLS